MTKESYSFGVDTEARLYTETSGMTNKRFTEQNLENHFNRIYDNQNKKVVFDEDICDLLNTLYDENEELKKELHKLKLVNEMLSMDFSISEHELWRENQQLKQEKEQLQKEVDYIKNSITEHIKHQKTELGQKALKEVIEDYNEWLLGH